MVTAGPFPPSVLHQIYEWPTAGSACRLETHICGNLTEAVGGQQPPSVEAYAVQCGFPAHSCPGMVQHHSNLPRSHPEQLTSHTITDCSFQKSSNLSHGLLITVARRFWMNFIHMASVAILNIASFFEAWMNGCPPNTKCTFHRAKALAPFS